MANLPAVMISETELEIRLDAALLALDQAENVEQMMSRSNQKTETTEKRTSSKRDNRQTKRKKNLQKRSHLDNQHEDADEKEENNQQSFQRQGMKKRVQ